MSSLFDSSLMNKIECFRFILLITLPTYFQFYLELFVSLHAFKIDFIYGQVNVVNILIPVVAYTSKREMVIKYIRPSIVPNLLRSKDCNLMVQVNNEAKLLPFFFPPFNCESASNFN